MPFSEIRGKTLLKGEEKRNLSKKQLYRWRLEKKRFPVKSFHEGAEGNPVKILRLAGNSLSRRFPGKFVSLVLFGSRSKGTARNGSDADLHLVVRNAGLRDLFEMSEHLESQFAEEGLKASPAYFYLDVGKLPEFVEDVKKLRNVGQWARKMALTFGLAYGRKINRVRLDILREIEKLPEVRKMLFWDQLRKYHKDYVVMPRGSKLLSKYPFALFGKGRSLRKRKLNFSLPKYEDRHTLFETIRKKALLEFVRRK